MPGPFSLRPYESGDEPFLLALYRSTREEELSVVPWTLEQKQAFIGMQFAAQSKFYSENFKAAEFLVILHGETPAGRLITDRRPTEFYVIDIALLPAYRNLGIGGTLLRALHEEAEAVEKPLRIHVEKTNPARRLYERLGFRPLKDEGVYDLMEWPRGA
jgi:ribosomal protein S18 acetylase RimI-like enzyme